jgi:hypothetical protein
MSKIGLTELFDSSSSSFFSFSSSYFLMTVSAYSKSNGFKSKRMESLFIKVSKVARVRASLESGI